MPCEVPTHEHHWPSSGELCINSCEKICGFCPGKAPLASSYGLKKHVEAVHIKKGTHPSLTVVKSRNMRASATPGPSDEFKPEYGHAAAAAARAMSYSVHGNADAARNKSIATGRTSTARSNQESQLHPDVSTDSSQSTPYFTNTVPPDMSRPSTEPLLSGEHSNLNCITAQKYGYEQPIPHPDPGIMPSRQLSGPQNAFTEATRSSAAPSANGARRVPGSTTNESSNRISHNGQQISGIISGPPANFLPSAPSVVDELRNWAGPTPLIPSPGSLVQSERPGSSPKKHRDAFSRLDQEISAKTSSKKFSLTPAPAVPADSPSRQSAINANSLQFGATSNLNRRAQKIPLSAPSTPSTKVLTSPDRAFPRNKTDPPDAQQAYHSLTQTRSSQLSGDSPRSRKCPLACEVLERDSKRMKLSHQTEKDAHMPTQPDLLTLQGLPAAITQDYIQYIDSTEQSNISAGNIEVNESNMMRKIENSLGNSNCQASSDYLPSDNLDTFSSGLAAIDDGFFSASHPSETYATFWPEWYDTATLEVAMNDPELRRTAHNGALHALPGYEDGIHDPSACIECTVRNQISMIRNLTRNSLSVYDFYELVKAEICVIMVDEFCKFKRQQGGDMQSSNFTSADNTNPNGSNPSTTGSQNS